MACGLALCSWIDFATAAESNEDFVRRKLHKYFMELVEKLPATGSDTIAVQLSVPAADNLSMSNATLNDCLRIRGFAVNANEPLSDGCFLSCNISELQFKYVNRNAGVFSRGLLFRVLDIAGSFSFRNDGAVISDDFLTRSYDEQISFSERIALEQKSSRLFYADPPPGPVQRLWEPLIVTTVIGGLVYLFFASR
jgi:hypothetical protein